MDTDLETHSRRQNAPEVSRVDRMRNWHWTGGASPNPGGRPKRRPVSSAIFKAATSKVPDCYRIDPKTNAELFPEGSTWMDVITQALERLDTSGNVTATREIREAIEGRSAIRGEAFGDLFDDQPMSHIKQSMMDLHPVDRRLVVSATEKVIALTKLYVKDACEAEDARKKENVASDQQQGSTLDSGIGDGTNPPSP